MANATGAIIELSNYLEQRISQKSAEFAAVRCTILNFGILIIFQWIRTTMFLTIYF